MNCQSKSAYTSILITRSHHRCIIRSFIFHPEQKPKNNITHLQQPKLPLGKRFLNVLWKMFKRLAFLFLEILRYVAFTLLFAFRKPIRFFVGLCCSPFMLFMIIMIALFMPEDKAISLCVTITFFALSLAFLHFYDFLLMKLSRDPIVLN
jgi:hypothetical protein